MVTGFDAINTMMGIGAQEILGGYQIAAILLLIVCAGLLLYTGIDFVATIGLVGILALAFSHMGWIGPTQMIDVIVLVIWALGFAYYWIMFINR